MSLVKDFLEKKAAEQQQATKPAIETQPLRDMTFVDAETASIALTDADVRAISEMLGINVNNSDSLRKAVGKMSTLDVEGVKITLEPYLLQRLRTRCLDKDWPNFLARTVRELLAGYAGC